MSSNSLPESRIILVTGANRGIGLAVVKKFFVDFPKDTVLLASRDRTRGEEALSGLGSPANVHVIELDTSSKESIDKAAAEIRQKYKHLDIIINNAGIARMDNSFESAKATMETNYFGVRWLNDKLISLVRVNGRIVNVSSGFACYALHGTSKELHAKYSSDKLTADEIDHSINDLLRAIEKDEPDKAGFDMRFGSYGASKAALNALTRVEAREWKNKNVLVFSVCPGFCSTDLNNHAEGARDPALGAESIAYVVNTPTDELENGAMYSDGKKKEQSIEPSPAFIKSILEMAEKAKK